VGNLIKNEWMKIFRRPGTYVMVAILVISIAIVGFVVKYQQNGMDVSEDPKWEQVLQAENNALKQQMDQSRTNIEKQ